ncbi:aliphatic sulfonate ABC transporter substrate-binding protein [Komagataeibacter kakiaceti]
MLFSRRQVVAVLAAQGVMAGIPWRARGATRTIRVGYQKYGTLILLKTKGFLEDALRPAGIGVEWAQFPAGPPLLQALVAGALDFGQTGDLPPVFVQASSPDALVYAGHEARCGASEAIIVPASSTIRSVADLKGRRVAVTRGADAHWLLVASLRKHGLTLGDVSVSYLLPAAARPAFETGQVDAWAIWDPYLSGADADTRTIATGDDVEGGTAFYLARRGFFEESPDLVRTVLAAVAKCDDWAANHRDEVIALLARSTGLAPDVVARSLAKLRYGLLPMTPDVVAGQQAIADGFHAAGLLTTVPDVAAAAPKLL